MRLTNTNLLSGLFFLALGAATTLYAWAWLPIGSPAAMGPGFFPFVLGLVQCVLGLVILAHALAEEGELLSNISWRGVLLIGAAPCIFGATIGGLGLVGALLLSIFTASRSSRRIGALTSLAVSVVLTAACVLIFSYGLGLPLRLIGPWLSAWRT